MKVTPMPFQEKAIRELRQEMAEACDSFRRRGKTQVVSLQAPTGAGKTIIAAALIESIYCGMTMPDGSVYTEQPEAIFVWLSDSPELNEQSRQKIELKTSKLRFGQCETISEESFNREMLEDGKIYFLNTQKISKSGNLTKHSDNRQYTIWETLDNTIVNKADHLYFIIDEAHRGAKSKSAAGTDTTIMQRFIKGYDYVENGIPRSMRSMPVVLGISATAARFNTLISNITNVSLQTYVITANDVRESGLLKDRILLIYPDDESKSNDIVLLEAAVDEWQKKCRRWQQYISDISGQAATGVDPVLVVQVCQGTAGALSDTDLHEVITRIEQKCGSTFQRGEVVHCFGETARVEINGLEIPHVNASDIADDHKIRVVLFKEALSTGWDCPRAETMMSFAAKKDPTYIAQLLGRMVRTPLQRRIDRDEFLNDVKLYLPHFDKDHVQTVIDELQSNEGSEIPTEVNGESLAEPIFVNYTVHVPRQKQPPEGQMSLFDIPAEEVSNTGVPGKAAAPAAAETVPQTAPAVPAYVPVEAAPEYPPEMTAAVPVSASEEKTPDTSVPKAVQLSLMPEIDREEILKFINAQGYRTYLVRRERINDYLKSLLDLADLLTYQMVYLNAREEVIDDVVGMIRGYIDELHKSGEYDVLAGQVLEFRLSVQVFDAFGKEIHANSDEIRLFSDTDLDRQVRNADAKLGKYGFPDKYGARYYQDNDPSAHKIDCILFAADDNCRSRLGFYAKNKLNDFVRKYRIAIVNKSEACKKKYHDILADSDIVSEQIFAIPENITVAEDADGREYTDHLLADEKTGIARIKMNGWETELIEEEERQSDFVCWLRNPSKAVWGLCLPYDKGGMKNAFYPDFLIVRNDAYAGYVVDILEPHGNQYADNLPKAKALAEYAKKEDRLGRIQLIHKTATASGSKFLRLDLTDRDNQEKVLLANTDDELNNIFTVNGITE